jgi:hypothetical protein
MVSLDTVKAIFEELANDLELDSIGGGIGGEAARAVATVADRLRGIDWDTHRSAAGASSATPGYSGCIAYVYHSGLDSRFPWRADLHTPEGEVWLGWQNGRTSTDVDCAIRDCSGDIEIKYLTKI